MLDEVNKFRQKNNKYRPYNHSLTLKWHVAEFNVPHNMPYNSEPTEAIEWCQTTCHGRFSYQRNYRGMKPGVTYNFYFRDPSDRLQFVLTWQ